MPRFRIALLPVIFFSLQLLASAQSDQVELFGGYALERIAPGCGSNYRCGTLNNTGPTTNMSGWTTSLTGVVYKSFGFSAQLSGNDGTAELSDVSVHRTSYQFGPTYALRWQRMSVFAHALFGGVTQHSPDQNLVYTNFLWSLGGGLDLRATRRIWIRAAQLDYERQKVPLSDTGGPPSSPPVSVNGLRYSAGIVVRF